MQMKKAGRYSKLVLGGLLVLGMTNAKADLTPLMWTSTSNLADLGLNVWDQNAATSYAVDLNIPLLTFMAEQSTTNLTWDLDSVFTSFASTGDALTFNIAGANIGTTSPVYKDPNDSLLYSYQTGETGSNYFTTTYKQAQILTNQSNVQGEFGTQLVTGSEVATSSSPAYFNYTGGWGIGQIGNQNHSTVYGGGGADALSVAFYNSPGSATISSTAFIDTFPTGYFYLSQSSGNYYLNWSATAAATSAVPVPGAVWLFLGGVLTILGFHKRKAIV